ncbi:LacI family transcriptional regulator [Eubacteriales bacterium OttesenSCG-928-N13]|nr:LacI family transcriptional regulator [Eubacteriales bacterium OttesenSCG-928-N13]
MNIRDIAARCHVSVATVSRVLNEHPSVSPKTREKVLRVMREEGYTPNAFARGLGLDSMRMVGIVCADVANPFYSRAVALLEGSLRAKGFDTLLCCSGTQLKDKQKCLTLLLEKRVDAIMLVGSAFCEQTDNRHIQRAAEQLPLFLINAQLPLENVTCVLCDEREAIHDLVMQMAPQCKIPLYLHDMTKWAWAGECKLQGFLDGLHDAHLLHDADRVQAVENGVLSAQQCVEGLLDRGISFDGVIASEDLLAVGALKALTKHGIELPIVGFNNSMLCDCTMPSLSSMDNMLHALCPMAVDMLLRRLAGETQPRVVSVQAQLVQRETYRAS